MRSQSRQIMRRLPQAMVEASRAAISTSGREVNRRGNWTGSSAMNAGELMRAASVSRRSRNSLSDKSMERFSDIIIRRWARVLPYNQANSGGRVSGFIFRAGGAGGRGGGPGRSGPGGKV